MVRDTEEHHGINLGLKSSKKINHDSKGKSNTAWT